jgi:N-glycosylase/DNA lyase
LVGEKLFRSIHMVRITTATDNMPASLTYYIVWQIAQRDYKFGKGKYRTLTKATYDAIGDHFRDLWGKEAGWAHSILFAADLRTFSERLTVKVEIKEEDNKTFVNKTTTKVKLETSNGIKRELEEEKTVLEIEEYHNSGRPKRRRQA